MSKQPRDIELFIVDIFVAMQKVKEYTKPFDNEDDLRYSSLHWDATIRQLEIIGESLNNLLEDDAFNALAPDYFRKVVNFRNTIVHGYFGIDVSEVWNILTEKLGILEHDLRAIVKGNIDISLAIMSEIDEYDELDDQDIVEYLKSLRSEM